MKTGRRLRPLLWFLLWCAFLSLAFTRAYWVADSLLFAALVATLIVFTAAKMFNLWKYRSDPEMREAHASSGQGGIFKNDRWRRWAFDDRDDKK